MKTKNQTTKQPTKLTKDLEKVNGKKPEAKKEQAAKNEYAPKINNIYKGKSLSFLLENVEVVKSNLNNPFHSKEYDSYSSSIAILLTEKLKKEIYDLLATSYKSEKNVAIALENFLTEKVKVLEDGKEIFYASMKWIKKGNTVVPSKPLPVEGVEEGENFPYSFTGKIQVGFSFSDKFTFPCYLNGVIVEKVLIQESTFAGFTAKSSFNPTVEIKEEETGETIQDEIEAVKREEKAEKETGGVVGKIKRKFF